MVFYDLPSLSPLQDVESDGFIPDVRFSPNGLFAVQSNLAFILFGRTVEGTTPTWEEIDLRNGDAVDEAFATTFMPDGRLLIYQTERGGLAIQIWSFTDMSAVTDAGAGTTAVPEISTPAPAGGSLGGRANPVSTAQP
jgi:hypothetical protein